MSLANELRTLYHLTLAPVKGDSHQDRLESFYSGQASNYDSFRKRLLHGRERLYANTPCPPGGVWVDFGGGTGANLEFLGDRIHEIGKIYIVDLSASLLAVAKRRIEENAWSNVVTVLADAATWQPEEKDIDTATFSYSLTMIPNWFAAIQNAKELLRPEGHIGVVDFYVGKKYPAANQQQHSWLIRNFWPTWFANDNVFLSSDHLPFLQNHFAEIQCAEALAKVPYLPLFRVPHYSFIGRNQDATKIKD